LRKNDSLTELEKAIKRINSTNDKIIAKKIVGGYITSFLKKEMKENAMLLKRIAKMI